MSKLAQRLPVIKSIVGIPHRVFVILATPPLLAITAVEAAWEAYILAEYSGHFKAFHKVFSGLNITLLALLVVTFSYTYFSGIILKRKKIIKMYAHLALLKGFLLFFVGLLHLIAVVKDVDDFKTECQSKHTENFCNTLNTINIAFAVGLWLVQEVVLFSIAIALNSYLIESFNDAKYFDSSEQGTN